MESPEKFPPRNEAQERAIIEALTTGDVDFFRALGGRIVEGRSMTEVLRESGDGSLDDLIELAELQNEAYSRGEYEEEDGALLGRAMEEFEKRWEENGWYTNTRKGTAYEVFYRMLADDALELDVHITDDAYALSGEKLDDYVAIYCDSLKSRAQVERLLAHPVLKMLLRGDVTWDDAEVIDALREYEEEGVIPMHTTDRLQARACRREADHEEDWEIRKELLFKVERLGNHELGDDELRDIMRPIVKEALDA